MNLENYQCDGNVFINCTNVIKMSISGKIISDKIFIIYYHSESAG